MTNDEASDSGRTDGDRIDGDDGEARGRLGAEADRAVEGFDQGLIDGLAWLLDTETRARIYIYLRKYPGRTSEEIAEGTGLYPSTVRESLAELAEEGIVEREKRQSGGAGNNPYEYTAIPPSSLVSEGLTQVQDQLNAICNLDRHLDTGTDTGTDEEPIRIEVREERE